MGARNFPRAVTRPGSAAALALTMAVAVATTACGGRTGSLSARAAGGLPSDLSVARHGLGRRIARR
jgi:hypothetical protein